MDDLVVVEIVATEPEAELRCSLLRSADIPCMHRVTNYGAGAADGLSVGGPHEILVRQQDVGRAREVIAEP